MRTTQTRVLARLRSEEIRSILSGDRVVTSELTGSVLKDRPRAGIFPYGFLSRKARPGVAAIRKLHSSSAGSFCYRPRLSSVRPGARPLPMSRRSASFRAAHTMTVVPAVSADRRYVRLSVNAFFNELNSLQTFSFPGGAVSGGGAFGGFGGMNGVMGGGGGGGAVGGGVGAVGGAASDGSGHAGLGVSGLCGGSHAARCRIRRVLSGIPRRPPHGSLRGAGRAGIANKKPARQPSKACRRPPALPPHAQPPGRPAAKHPGTRQRSKAVRNPRDGGGESRRTSR